jgi:hypothetical protein
MAESHIVGDRANLTGAWDFKMPGLFGDDILAKEETSIQCFLDEPSAFSPLPRRGRFCHEGE